MNRLVEPLAAQMARLPASWRPTVQAWARSADGRALLAFVDARVAEGAVVYPAAVWRALEWTPLDDLRVVILGQDPYHGPGQAEGLAFSVPVGLRVPPSLRNIDKELARDLGLPPASHGHLGAWARQGVLLLNTALTVEDGAPRSHARRGWEGLTDGVVAAAAADPSPKVFMLWGAPAQARAALVGGGGRHLVLTSNHPSPLSATRPPKPFVGNGHFGAANRFLKAAGRTPVDWSR